MRRTLSLCLLVVILAAASGVNGEGIREQRPTLVYGELGGKAVLYSMGIERYFTNVCDFYIDFYFRYCFGNSYYFDSANKDNERN